MTNLGDFFVHIIHFILLGHPFRLEPIKLLHFSIDFTHLLLFGLLGAVQLFLVVVDRPLPALDVRLRVAGFLKLQLVEDSIFLVLELEPLFGSFLLGPYDCKCYNIISEYCDE